MTHSKQVSFDYLFGYILACILILRTPEAFAAAQTEIVRILAEQPNDKPISLSKEQLESMTVLGRSCH